MHFVVGDVRKCCRAGYNRLTNRRYADHELGSATHRSTRESMPGRLIGKVALVAGKRAVAVHRMCGRWWPKAQRLKFGDILDEEGKAPPNWPMRPATSISDVTQPAHVDGPRWTPRSPHSVACTCRSTTPAFSTRDDRGLRPNGKAHPMSTDSEPLGTARRQATKEAGRGSIISSIEGATGIIASSHGYHQVRHSSPPLSS